MEARNLAETASWQAEVAEDDLEDTEEPPEDVQDDLDGGTEAVALLPSVRDRRVATKFRTSCG